jgi:hypothetical protein
MSRPRTPTALLAAKGAFRKDPARGRARAGEPKPRGKLGPSPSALKGAECACWDRLVELVPAGVLGDCDEPILELTARLWARVKSGRAKSGEFAQFRSCLRELGMTPSSRSNVSVPEDKTGEISVADI